MPIKAALLHFVHAARDLIFPPMCLVCKTRLPATEPLLFCHACIHDIKPLHEPLCPVCGKPFPSAAGGSHHCSACLKSPPFFHKARGLLYYTEAVAKLVHALKYQRSTIGLFTFHQIKEQLVQLQDLGQADVILPVPLHATRLRQRGYNQSLLIAKHLFPQQRHKIALDILVRTANSAPQTTLSGKARRRNLKGAFKVLKPQAVSKKTVLLVDDVFTTGTTLNECARTLRKAGADRVTALTLARVP